MIPHRLVRTVPEHTTDEVEEFWDHACYLHPAWDHITYRDPIDPNLFPLTAPFWPRCTSGAQLAGLIRLEALWHQGGIYLDSDVQVFRPLNGLCGHQVFAAWEDDTTIPDAVLGAEARHPAILACLELALARLSPSNQENDDWTTGPGAWSTGPGVTTTILGSRDDVTLFTPAAFFPVHYTKKAELDGFDWESHPETYAMHRWHASWLAPENRP